MRCAAAGREATSSRACTDVLLDLMYEVTSCVLFDVVRALRRLHACGLKTADGHARRRGCRAPRAPPNSPRRARNEHHTHIIVAARARRTIVEVTSFVHLSARAARRLRSFHRDDLGRARARLTSPDGATRRARVRMGLVHPANQFSGQDARADARKPCFDSFRKPPGGVPRAARGTSGELAYVEYNLPEEYPN